MRWPSILMAAASATLLAAGVLRHYVDVYLYRTVRGISFIFVGIDALGDVFSLVSVIFQARLDILGMVIYGTELVLWIGIFICGAYFNFIPWISAERARSQRKSPSIGGDLPPTIRERNERREFAAAASGITLHDLPSSTSVFRTPSGDIEVIRQQSRSSGTGGRNGQHSLEHMPRRVA